MQNKPLKAYFNILKYRLNRRFNRQVVNNYPIMAYVDLTLFCNLGCPACPTGLKLDLRPKVAIEEAYFRAMIDELGDYLFYINMYNWGEPLLHKRAPEMMRYASDKGIYIRISSNLSMPLTDDYIERLVKSGLDKLIVSIDGVTQETYETYRKKGKLDVVLENMRRIQEVKARLGSATPEIEWQYLVFKHNQHELDEVRENYKQWGADTLSIGGAMIPFNSILQASDIPQFNLAHPDNDQQLRTRQNIDGGKPCSWLYGIFSLNPNGQVSPCCAPPVESLDFGNYKIEDGFLSVWNNSTYQRARSLFGPKKSPSEPPFTEIKPEDLDGAGINVGELVAENELVCHKCPIPHSMELTTTVTDNIIFPEVLRQIKENHRPRYVLAYIIMGMPNFWLYFKGWVKHHFPFLTRPVRLIKRSLPSFAR